MSLRPITVLVSASGAPGTAALLGALRRNGERDLRLVGTDMSERSVGRHLCDAFHIVPAGSDPGFPDAMRLEEAVELLPAEGGPDLLVMELATGGERTIDGIADGERVVLGHPKTREAMRAGLAMYFVTLDDPALMEIADRIVEELGIEWFFNIQLVGEHVIEVNPRISTIVYQEDLNLPYLGVKRALGEISDDELAAYAARIRPGRTALRYFDQLEWG